MFFQGHSLWLYSGNEKKHGYLNLDKAKKKRSHAKAPQYHLPELRGKQSSQRKPTDYSQQTWPQPSVDVIRRISNDLRDFIFSHSFYLCVFAPLRE